MLDSDSTEALLRHLRHYEYVLLRHALAATLRETASRLGAVQSLDVDDFDEKTRLLSFRHRPNSGSRLENANSGELACAIPDPLATVLFEQ